MNTDDFFQSTNEHHIYLHSRNANWLAREIDNVPNNNEIFNCTYMCANNQISGLDAICTSANYSAAGGATTYNWTITQGANLVSITGNGTQNVTVTALPNSSGTLTLSLTLGGTCGDVTINKTIWVGVANTSYTLINNTKCEFQYKPIYSDPTATYFWEYISGTGGASNVYEMNLNQYDNNLFFNCYESFTVQFKLTVTNACGSVIRYVTDSHTIDPGPPYCALQRSANSNEPQTIFKIYPNPQKA